MNRTMCRFVLSLKSCVLKCKLSSHAPSLQNFFEKQNVLEKISSDLATLCVGQEFSSRCTLENPEKALEEWHYSENISRALQIVFSKANAPAKWPGVVSRNARDYLARGGSPTITTEVFPENESDGAQLCNFHCKSIAN